MENINPQAAQMADESMVRNLAAQARALWPQERDLFLSYGLPAQAVILDVGCGTGEIASRLAETFPSATVTGLDILPVHIAHATERHAQLAPRLAFREGNAFALDIETASVDLAICRHMLQAVPHPERVVAEMTRVLKPGGRLHLLAEDYAMMHFHPTRQDTDKFFAEAVCMFGEKTGTDLRSGRRMYTVCRRLGFQDVTVRYLIVDTVRTDRELFASIWEAWRDGYTEVIAHHCGWTPERVREGWNDMIGCIRDPDGYGVWMIPIISATR